MASILGLTWRDVDLAYAARLVGELAPPRRDPAFCPDCPHRASYWTIKQTLAIDGRQGIVSDDISCYTLGLHSTGYERVNSVHCMGSGLGVASGLGQLKKLSFDQPVVCVVVGDSTFYHAALLGLINAR